MCGRKEKRRWLAWILTGVVMLAFTACGKEEEQKNLIREDREEERIVNFFSPMEKSDPDAEKIGRAHV